VTETLIDPRSLASEKASSWTFLTVHAHVLLVIAGDPGVRLADIARIVGVTERTTQRAVTDLVTAGYIERTKEGRRNRYRVRTERKLRDPLWRDRSVGDLIALLASPEPAV
jgi:DNA-binding MarR family transcriptional regulator